jgi:Kef-type K+ transport system membrane component KefB
MFDLSILLIQIAVILLTARVVGWIFRRFHQPQVIGEMLAGIMLGPSLLGWLAPGTFAALFPSSSLDFINALSQIGLIVFIFLMGLELDLKVMRKRGHSAVVISHSSIIVPFLLGMLLAFLLYPRLSTASVPFTNFALFLGVSMSITAFPVLARILNERNMIHTSVGTLAMAAAAVDDATAWTILAGVVLLVGASATTLPFWAILLGAVGYAFFMLFLGILGEEEALSGSTER